MSDATQKTLDEWKRSAAGWEKHQLLLRTLFAPVTGALIHDARIEPGARVLDVAAGPGEPSLTIAAQLGASGRVHCTDATHAMVVAARDQARRQELENVAFSVCSAESLPYASHAFDALVCRFGVMFAPDPAQAVRDMLRVTKRGRSIALAVWAEAERNPFLSLVNRLLDRHDPVAAVDPDAPGAFRFAPAGKLRSVFEAAGASAIRDRELDFSIDIALDVEQFWRMRAEISDAFRERIQRLDADLVARVKVELAGELDALRHAQALRFPARVRIVSAMSA